MRISCHGPRRFLRDARDHLASIVSRVVDQTWDDPGTPVDRYARPLVYDAWNRLVEAQNGGTSLIRYEYDGLTRRIQEASTHQFFSAAWQVLEEQVAGDTTASYAWSPVYVDAMIARDRNTTGDDSVLEERLYVLQDANFNVTAIADTSGNIVERYLYDPYGQRTILDANFANDADNTSDFAFQHGHQGGKYDSVLSNQMLFRNRVYDVETMRWLQQDQLGYVDGGTLYSYISQTPPNYVDPLGQQTTAPATQPASPSRISIPKLHQIPAYHVRFKRQTLIGMTPFRINFRILCECPEGSQSWRFGFDGEMKVAILIDITNLGVAMDPHEKDAPGFSAKYKNGRGQPDTWAGVYGHEQEHAARLTQAAQDFFLDLPEQYKVAYSSENSCLLAKRMLQDALHEDFYKFVVKAGAHDANFEASDQMRPVGLVPTFGFAPNDYDGRNKAPTARDALPDWVSEQVDLYEEAKADNPYDAWQANRGQFKKFVNLTNRIE